MILRADGREDGNNNAIDARDGDFPDQLWW